MIRALYVAAGGGGDAIAAAILAAAQDDRQPTAIASLSWDRLLVDPVPGPRSRDDFSGLVVHSPACTEVAETTRSVSPAHSLLPQLAAALGARLFLLDPITGAEGLGHQVQATASHVGATSINLVDVGGDLIAEGTESGLRSPLADALVLAGCLNAGLPTTALVCGPGLDGELTEDEVLRRGRLLGADQPTVLTAEHVRAFRPIFRWHPSEATGLLVAAASGRRGVVEVRDAASRVTLTNRSRSVLTVPPDAIDQANPYASHLLATQSLAEVNEAMRAIRGATELDYERDKADTRSPGPSGPLAAQVIDAVTQAAHQRDVDFLTVRRLAEVAGLTAADTGIVVDTLQRHDARRLDPPLWDVRPFEQD